MNILRVNVRLIDAGRLMADVEPAMSWAQDQINDAVSLAAWEDSP